MSDARLRAFIAIRPSGDLRKACSEVIEAGCGLPVRWTRPESVHLTLKFLGGVPAGAIPGIHQALRQTAEGSPAFSVVARGLGCFPNATRPRVLWMGLDDPRRELLQLQRRIESALAALGIPPEERPFRPHLTLARARVTRGGKELDVFLNAYRNHTFAHLVVSQIHLMRSDLHAKGAVHTRLHSVILRGASINQPSERGGNDVETNSYNS